MPLKKGNIKAIIEKLMGEKPKETRLKALRSIMKKYNISMKEAQKKQALAIALTIKK